MDNCSLHLIGDNKKIVRLNDKRKIAKRQPSQWQMKRQVVLFSLKERLEKFLGQTAVFENETNFLKTLFPEDVEPVPEFYLKGANYKTGC